jgi:hypothetical protein
MKRIVCIFVYLSCVIALSAQDIEVKKFEPLEKDQTAALSPRRDINGVTCGLVKVLLKEPGAEFEGSVMGDVQFTGKEYLVYLPNGTKRLGIKHPDYLPTTIVFADYGTKKVASSTTYELKVKTNKKQAKVDNSKKGMAVFNIKPSNAMLLIDGQIADGSGGAYTLSLPYGTHYYTVKLNDFSITNQQVKIDKNAKNINVDLTEYFAKVSINCPTEDAELSINGEQKGVGRWGGMMIPGKYTIEASKDGCHSQTRQIELKDNDEVTVDFTKLKTITGSLRVDYEPAGADVLLNGKKVGVTPLELKELPVGNYQLEIWKEYYVKVFATVKIAEDQEWKEKGELKLTEFGELVKGAEDRTSDEWYYTAEKLAQYYRFGAACGYKGDQVVCDKDTIQIPFNPVKAIHIYKLIANEGGDLAADVAKEGLGPCYPSVKDDAELSYCWATNSLKEWGDGLKYLQMEGQWKNLPYAVLAWHYYYGIGCEKNIDEAKKMMRWACLEDGRYYYPSYKILIKEMGLDSELKYISQEEWIKENTINE